MKVSLSHAKNLDVDGGYWTPPTDKGAKKLVTVKSYEEASKKCEEYIKRNKLGGGNWSGGQIFDEKGKQIARVSYNGRVWQGTEADTWTGEKYTPTPILFDPKKSS